MNITGAIFDFDGTLFDSMPIWETVGQSYLEYIGIENAAEMAPVFLNMNLWRAIRIANEKYGLQKSADEIRKDFYAHLQTRYLNEAKPKNDILPFLCKLQNMGVKMCIATATDKAPVSAALSKYGMLDYFGEIFTADSVGAGKTEPKMFREALKFLGTDKKSTWIFEDALYSVRTAKKDGFPVVGVYDPSEPGADELKSLVDIYICRYNELKI